MIYVFTLGRSEAGFSLSYLDGTVFFFYFGLPFLFAVIDTRTYVCAVFPSTYIISAKCVNNTMRGYDPQYNPIYLISCSTSS